MSRLLIRNARLVNEGQVFDADVLVAYGRIEKIASSIVSSQPILARCGWTPFAERSFRHSVSTTRVSGHLAWHNGKEVDSCQGLPLQFLR